MKKFIALATISAVYSGSVFAGNFEGWSVTGSLEQAKSTLSGAPIMQADGTQATSTSGNTTAKLITQDGSDTATGLKLGAAYGMALGTTLTTFGVDYSTSKASVVNPMAGVVSGTQYASTDPTAILNTDIKSRMDLYVAPGFMIDADSMAYAKVAYSTLNYSVSHGDPTQTVSGSAGKSGLSYGVGYKQMFDQRSPYFFTVEYMTGKSADGDVTGGSGSTAKSINTNNTFSSMSLGVGYSFK